jgi:hypothetical protein
VVRNAHAPDHQTVARTEAVRIVTETDAEHAGRLQRG